VKIDNRLKFAFGVSIVFHICLYVLFLYIRVPGLFTIVNRTKHFFSVKSADQSVTVNKPVHKRGITYANRVLKFEKPSEVNIIREAVDKDEKPFEKEEIRKDEEPTSLFPVENADDAEPPLDKGESLKPEAEIFARPTRDNIVGAEIKDKEGLINSGDFSQDAGVSVEFAEKMPGFTPEVTGNLMDAIKDSVATKFGKDNLSIIRRKGNFASLNQYLACELSVYQDPEDGEKYYEVSIRSGKDADKLKNMPKEILFLIDCSLSIQPERLDEFKKGVRYCLEHLNPDDVFNIIAFRDQVIWFKQESLKPNKEVIKEAERFISTLSATHVTDAYKALSESIKVPQAIIPSYIVLFSDGRPTHGITNSMRIINDFTNINNGKRPVFAFSGGVRVNRYLLDFISYKNRGWTEYADRSFIIGKHIAMLYNKIKDPLLLNLRYRVSKINNNELYPKQLPDFFRNAEFNLYGKYTDENDFSVQLLGELKDETSEFLIIGALKDAKKGGPEIARNWAFNKIYYLIGLLEYNKNNKTILDEISRLCKKYSIQTPYTEGLRD